MFFSDGYDHLNSDFVGRNRRCRVGHYRHVLEANLVQKEQQKDDEKVSVNTYETGDCNVNAVGVIRLWLIIYYQ